MSSPISPTPIPKTGVTAMKTSGRRAVWAWMNPCWTESSASVARGRRSAATAGSAASGTASSIAR